MSRVREWEVSGDGAVYWSTEPECVRVMLDYGLRILVPLLPEPAAKPIRFRDGFVDVVCRRSVFEYTRDKS